MRILISEDDDAGLSKERRPKESLQLDTLEGFADVLQADPRLNICIFIHPARGVASNSFEPDELPYVGLLKLVEKWKTDRMILMKAL